ncbi:AMP-binding protein [Maritalea mobilis]|uniref:class I adenylate-forming enzyme family protein n=1 Tax=Maritalea mobilis TaxID=483324 RepID=UPI001C94B4E0|nr:AMP-binding protein [Maritalea mobilis]MBY6202845.1 AMP-binding protein [Maritalea mobilis]
MIADKTNLSDLLYSLARDHGDKPALVQRLKSVTYAELPLQVSQLARQMAVEGVHAGDHVGIAQRDSLNVVKAMMAAWMLDAVAVPVDFRLRGEDRARLVADFDLAVLFEDRPMPGQDYASIQWTPEFEEDCARQPSTPLPTQGGNPALISLSSGTTGRPLGVVISHRTMMMRMLSYSMECAYPTGAKFLNAFPLSFSASRNHTLAHLMRGGTIHFHPPTFGASELAERINAEGMTFVFAVPATVSALLEIAGEREGPLFPSVEMIYCGGSAISAQDMIAAHEKLSPNVIHCYSSTLTGTVSVLSGENVRARAQTSGKILPTVRLEVVDPNGDPLPVGETGALRVRSPGLADGFYNARDREDGDRIRDGWGYTGDIGHIDEAGFLTIEGRTTDMIIRGGLNVFPAEVEAVVENLDGVSEAVAVGFPDKAMGEEIAVFVVPRAGNLAEADIFAQCQLALPPGKRPSRVEIVESLPRNTNGKILRRDLKARLAGPEG